MMRSFRIFCVKCSVYESFLRGLVNVCSYANVSFSIYNVVENYNYDNSILHVPKSGAGSEPVHGPLKRMRRRAPHTGFICMGLLVKNQNMKYL